MLLATCHLQGTSVAMVLGVVGEREEQPHKVRDWGKKHLSLRERGDSLCHPLTSWVQDPSHNKEVLKYMFLKLFKILVNSKR